MPRRRGGSRPARCRRRWVGWCGATSKERRDRPWRSRVAQYAAIESDPGEPGVGRVLALRASRVCSGAGLPGARGWLRGGPESVTPPPHAGGEIGGGHGGGMTARLVRHPSQHNQLREFVGEPGPGYLEGSAVNSFLSPMIVTDALVLNTRAVAVERISISRCRSTFSRDPLCRAMLVAPESTPFSMSNSQMKCPIAHHGENG